MGKGLIIMNIDEQAANALLTKFNIAQIYHDNLPEHGNYPMIMYTDLQENPALHGDNNLLAREHIIRVTIVTSGNHEINSLKKDVETAMIDAGFMWQNTAKIHDKNEYYTSLDFSKGEIENE